MRHHLEKDKSNLKGIGMIAGCIAVMLLAVVLLSNSEYSNLGFLALLLYPVMHLLMHCNGHRGKAGQKKDSPLKLTPQRDGDSRPQGNRGCH